MVGARGDGHHLTDAFGELGGGAVTGTCDDIDGSVGAYPFKCCSPGGGNGDRPAASSDCRGAMFLAVEDEAGVMNVVVPSDIYRVALRGAFVVVEMLLTRHGQAVGVVTRKVIALHASN